MRKTKRGRIKGQSGSVEIQLKDLIRILQPEAYIPIARKFAENLKLAAPVIRNLSQTTQTGPTTQTGQTTQITQIHNHTPVAKVVSLE